MDLSNVSIRTLTLNDDLQQVAKLIYKTDDFIYPALLGDLESGAKLLAEIIKHNSTLISCDNILVVDYQGQIIGILLALLGSSEWDLQILEKLPSDTTYIIPESWEYTSREYMDKLKDYQKNNLIYISNVSVDEKYRNLGLGRKLIQYIIDTYGHSKALALHVLTDNQAAIHLYESCAFKIKDQMCGFSLDGQKPPQVYYMVRKRI